jgi:hypothetical protein
VSPWYINQATSYNPTFDVSTTIIHGGIYSGHSLWTNPQGFGGGAILFSQDVIFAQGVDYTITAYVNAITSNLLASCQVQLNVQGGTVSGLSILTLNNGWQQVQGPLTGDAVLGSFSIDISCSTSDNSAATYNIYIDDITAIVN